MARHKDIDRAHALLEDEGWHIIDKTVHADKSKKRRDKRKCKYYLCVSDTCALTRYACKGSSRCKQYRVQTYNRLVALYMAFYGHYIVVMHRYSIVGMAWIYGRNKHVRACMAWHV